MTDATHPATTPDYAALALTIKQWGSGLGFAQVRVADAHLAGAEAGLQRWLDAGFHGQMDYMAAHGNRRAHPAWDPAGATG